MHARSNASVLGLAGALTALLLLSPAARADVIVTVNGGKISGTIVKETAREVHVRNRGGIVVTIRRDEIDRIEREDTGAVFAQRRSALKKDDVKGLLELARWAYDQGLGAESRSCLEAVLAIDPEQPTARRVLGYQKVGDKWLRGDPLHEALGHVKYKGRWVTPQERDYLEAGFTKDKDGKWVPPQREPSAAGEDPRAVELPAELAELMRVVRGNSSLEKRLEAMRAIAGRGEDGRTALVAELESMLARSQKKLTDHFKRGAGKVRAKLATRIIERRREAWAIIFDKSKYPDENHGAVGQPLVDAAVKKLYRSYDDPLSDLAADDPEVQDLLARVTEAAGWLREFGGKAPKDGALLSALTAEVAALIDMRRFPVSADDAKMLEKSQRILEFNRAVQTTLSDEERACVDATNEYRMLFGLPALKAFEPLVQAARKHSAEMNRLKYFDHNSPTPANRSPEIRCAREGARFSGENIAMGMSTGRAAFHAWYTSSGHHRNILGKGHRSIGIGQDGKYWTQNFGSDDPSP